jgi:hypothetical protein
MHLQGYLALVWISTNNGRGRTMLLLLTSAVALLLGIGIMPLSAWRPTHEFDVGLVVTIVAGCTFLGLGFGGAVLGGIMLLIQYKLASNVRIVPRAVAKWRYDPSASGFRHEEAMRASIGHWTSRIPTPLR